MDAETIGLLLAGFVVLVGGGELLVRGASALAGALGMSSRVIGLTVVAFATSAPELAVTLQAVGSGSPDLAVGNVVGSNIANVLLILGIAAVMAPLVVRSQMVRNDVPVMIGMGILLLLLSLDGGLSRADAVILLTGLMAYLVFTIRASRNEPAANLDRQAGSPPPAGSAAAVPAAKHPLVLDGLLVVAGVAALVFGANLLVDGATRVATALGMPEMVIGLTVLAVGTSLPELATSIIATVRGERDLAIGNAIGSNIFNIGAVLGISGLLAPAGIPVAGAALRFDLPVMIAVSILLMPIVYTGFTITRWEGALFLGLYAAYTAYLLLNAADHQRLPAFSAVMMWFVLPIVAVSLGVLTGFDAGLKRGQAQAREELSSSR